MAEQPSDPRPEPSREPEHPAQSADEREPEWVRRRRLAEIFGEGLPEQTRDDADPHGDARGGGKGDDWYREQVPPHHG